MEGVRVACVGLRVPQTDRGGQGVIPQHVRGTIGECAHASELDVDEGPTLRLVSAKGAWSLAAIVHAPRAGVLLSQWCEDGPAAAATATGAGVDTASVPREWGRLWNMPSPSALRALRRARPDISTPAAQRAVWAEVGACHAPQFLPAPFCHTWHTVTSATLLLAHALPPAAAEAATRGVRVGIWCRGLPLHGWVHTACGSGGGGSGSGGVGVGGPASETSPALARYDGALPRRLLGVLDQGVAVQSWEAYDALCAQCGLRSTVPLATREEESGAASGRRAGGGAGRSKVVAGAPVPARAHPALPASEQVALHGAYQTMLDTWMLAARTDARVVQSAAKDALSGGETDASDSRSTASASSSEDSDVEESSHESDAEDSLTDSDGGSSGEDDDATDDDGGSDGDGDDEDDEDGGDDGDDGGDDEDGEDDGGEDDDGDMLDESAFDEV